MFVPDRLTLQSGRFYRLEVVNVSLLYHNWVRAPNSSEAAPRPPARSWCPRESQAACLSRQVATEFLLQGALWWPLRLDADGSGEWLLYPRRKGVYPFVCTVAGHDNMRGVLTVV